jgi:regulatory protein
MDSGSRKTCYQKALQILTRRDHSCDELSRKLHSRGFETQQVEAAIRECRHLNYINDDRFADTYANQLQRKGYGINSIKHKLYTKGVPETVIETVLAAYGTDKAQLKLCRQVLAKKMKPIAGEDLPEGQAAKLYRYLFNRGFPGHIIRQTMDEMIFKKS